MDDYNPDSRVDKFEKRRKNTKSISIMLILGGVLIIILLGMFLFGGGDKEDNSGQPSTDSTSENEDDKTEENGDSKAEEKDTSVNEDSDSTSDEENTNSDESTNVDDAETKDEPTPSENTNNSDVEKENVEVSNDNVIEAYTADWEPIGTEQEGAHTKQFAAGTQDRMEMEEAIRVATGIQQGDMITWWLANGGEKDVIATVSNKAQDATYRVYLTWVDNEGWKPTKVELLKENDKK